MEKFKPDAVVMECGADSLEGDELGLFHLSIKARPSTVPREICTSNLYLGSGFWVLCF